ncbi:MAG: hypothetical protein QXR14_08065, partial [Sulfolobales archaeon]
KVADFVFLSIQSPIVINLGIISITIPESPILLPFIVGIALPLLYLLLVPFLDRSDERHPLRRPVHTAIGALIVVYLIQTTIWGALTPGEPVGLDKAVEVMVPPMIVVVLGIYLLSKRHAGIVIKRSNVVRGLVATYMGVLLLILSGVVLAIRSWESLLIRGGFENLVSIFIGALGSAVGILMVTMIPKIKIDKATMATDPDREEALEEVKRPVEAERELPVWMFIMGAFYLVMIVSSIAALIYIDPFKAGVVASALAITMLSLAGLSHMAYRTTNIMPYESDYKELKPHIAIIVLMIISMIGLIPR